MSFANHYLAKHNITGHIESPVPENLGLIVIIPCYNEPDLLKPIQSLLQTDSPVQHTEVIIIINDSEQDDEKVKQQNLISYEQCKKIHPSTDHITVHPLYYTNLPNKHAGAGFARKLGMDQAVYRFNSVSQSDGIIVSLDADTVVEKNYLTEIEKAFSDNKTSINGCNIYFEHPSSGSVYNQSIYEAITLYELRLRYYCTALRYAGFPYAYHTVGSCFAVNAETYVKQGGMNKRQGGEDFYFLNKIFPLGRFKVINSTTVFPSPRPSSRVPFGTGPSIEKHINKQSTLYQYYSFELFLQLKELLSSIHKCYQQEEAFLRKYLHQLPKEIQHYLTAINFIGTMQEINGNVASESAFTNRFFNYFNAFKIVKFLNNAGVKNISYTIDEAQNLLLTLKIAGSENPTELLKIYRKIDRNEITSPLLPQL